MPWHTQEVIHAAHGFNRFTHQLVVVYVEEAVLAHAFPRSNRIAHTDAQMLRHLSTQPVHVALTAGSREDAALQTGIRRYDFGWIAMRHDEPRIGVGVDDRLQMEHVVRRFEQPEVRRSPRLK